MRRPGWALDRALGAAQVAFALAVGAAAAAQTRPAAPAPEHWQSYEQKRRELLAAGPAQAAAGLWGDKTDAGLDWLHRFLTGIDDAAVYERWFAADAAATLRVLHEAMWARAATDRQAVLQRDLHLLEALKGLGLFDAAARLLESALLPCVGDERPERFELLLQAAEVHRRSYEWDRAGSALDAAAAVARESGDAENAEVRLRVQRAALLLARGLPDLAVPEIEAAESGTADPWLRAQTVFVRLRLEHALRRPDRAVSVLQEFLAAPVPPALAADKAWRGRLSQLRIRAALAVLGDPEVVSTHAGEAVAWLQAAIGDASTSVDERNQARMVLLVHRLDRGELDGVEADLAAAAAELPAMAGQELEERRLSLATLGLRAARCAGAGTDVLRARALVLDRLWQALVDRWHQQPASRVGEGPLFFGDLRRALVELLRSRLAVLGDTDAMAAVLRDVVRAQSVGSLAKELAAATPDLAAIRSGLCPPGHGLLVYVPGHDCSVALAIDADAVAVHVLAVGALGIDRRRQLLLSALQEARGGADPRAFLAAARASAEVLLPAPLCRSLAGWSSVTIVGLESLGYLPFELLPGPDGRRLGTTHAVTYLPSLPVGVWLAEHRRAVAPPQQRAARVRVLACPDAAAPADALDRPEPLQFGDAEAADLRAATAGTELQILRGAAATASACFRADGFDFVQVLAHGVRDERRADPQGLLFGDGQVLWPADLQHGGSPPYLLLTSCRAGRGRLRRGDDGRHQLSGAALLAGARGVVAPVLDVGYQSSLTFAADLHRGLWRDGLPLAEALRQARVAAAARGGPSAWDAFLYHLVGLGETPLARAAPASSASAAWWLGPGLVVATLALLAGRRWARWRTVRPRQLFPAGSDAPR